jgi:hypothetical protein
MTMIKFVIGSTGPIPRDKRSDLPVRRRSIKFDMERISSPLGQAIKEAIVTTIQTIEHRFDRLPIPVRYRASGAIEAWTTARSLSGRDGKKLAALLADPNQQVLELIDDLDDFVTSSLGQPRSTVDERDMSDIYTRSAICQAFWLRQGALYEPTSALHRLLEASDIASDVPMSLLRLPAPAVCIVPEPSLRDRPDGFEAVMVFEHMSRDGSDDCARHFTIFVWPHEDLPQPLLDMQTLTVFAGDKSRTIDEVITYLSLNHGLEGEALAFWRRVLDYVVKVLLYLSLDVASVIHERRHSAAPRAFAGLGKRKRLERLQAIEGLYDRYVVGPAVLSEISGPRGVSNDGNHEVRAHWRRGHFRMQAHGPAAAQRKLIFVMPVLVRADRLGADCTVES